MSRANVLMQPPTRITLSTGYAQPDKDALLVGVAKTIQISVEVYENGLTAGPATMIVLANNDIDPTPFGYPSTMVGGWFTPTVVGSISFATGAGTTGVQSIEVTKFTGKMLRYTWTAGSGPLAFAIFASLFDT